MPTSGARPDCLMRHKKTSERGEDAGRFATSVRGKKTKTRWSSDPKETVGPPPVKAALRASQMSATPGGERGGELPRALVQGDGTPRRVKSSWVNRNNVWETGDRGEKINATAVFGGRSTRKKYRDLYLCDKTNPGMKALAKHPEWGVEEDRQPGWLLRTTRTQKKVEV